MTLEIYYRYLLLYRERDQSPLGHSSDAATADAPASGSRPGGVQAAKP